MAGVSGTFWAFLTSSLQEGLVAQNFPLFLGEGSGQSGPMPVLQARPLCTGAGAGRPGYLTGRLSMCLGDWQQKGINKVFGLAFFFKNNS